MNSQIEQFARQSLKDGLAKLEEPNRVIFKRMYANRNLGLPINEVVDNMPQEKLDWAMQQVQRSLDQKEKEEK